MRTTIFVCAIAVSVLLPAWCCDEPKGTVEKSRCAYRNTFEFVWESSQEELRSNFKIESADRKTNTITTAWSTNLAPFSTQGRRDRLIVTVSGDSQSGWRASARQESETNNNEENPLDEAKAKWKTSPNDGSLAARFLQNLDTRLQPDERWRDRLAR
jgi:hypothetical protein